MHRSSIPGKQQRLLLLLLGATSLGAAAPPDFKGQLRHDLALSAWFDDARERGFVRVGSFTSKIYRAWKVALADLDGDGTREVLLGIWSNQRRHPEPGPHRTVWVLRWHDDPGELREAWRGSALARPLRDFIVQSEQLVAHEQSAGHCCETVYQWTGFGFASLGSKAMRCEAP